MTDILRVPKKTSIAAAVAIVDASVKARDIFHKNSDTLVAGFLVRHPDVDPADVELVFTPQNNGTIKFSIEPKEMHVPPPAPAPVIGEYQSVTQYFTDYDQACMYEKGWNDCRAAMIAQAVSVRAPEAMVSTLDAAL